MMESFIPHGQVRITSTIIFILWWLEQLQKLIMKVVNAYNFCIIEIINFCALKHKLKHALYLLTYKSVFF